MKILVVCQYYYPEPFRISDICEEFVKAGHEVLAVCGVPNYPEGKPYNGYRWLKRRNEIINGVRVHRCFTIGRRQGTLFRLLNYFSFALSSTLYTTFMREDFDVVFVNQLSPVMMANAAIAYKKRHKKKLLLYCLDLWPESLTVGGIRKGSFLYKIFHRISSKIYCAADKILVSSESFSKYFSEEFDVNNTEYLPQHAEELFDPKKCKKIANDTIDLMFAGNIGTAQSVETIIYAADRIKHIPNLRWHIVGDGTELENIKRISESLGLKNVIFHGRKALEEMPEYYSMADAMLVTMQKNDIISMTLPGKIQTYMAAGKPILGAIDGEASIVIKHAGCGMCCDAENADKLAEVVKDFINEKDPDKYAQAALSYYSLVFKKDKVMKKLMKELEFGT